MGNELALRREVEAMLAQKPDAEAFALNVVPRIEAAIELAETPGEANGLRAIADMALAYCKQAFPEAVAERVARMKKMHPVEEAYVKASAKAGLLWEPMRPGAGARTDLGKRSEVDPGFKSYRDATSCVRAGGLMQQGELDTYFELAKAEAKQITLGGAESAWRMLRGPIPFERMDGRYRVFYADPPWEYGNTRGTGYTSQEEHYPTMPLADIKAIPVKYHADDNAVLFMWATSPYLASAIEIPPAWGFSYKTSFVWDKVEHNPGHYNSVRHEFLLVCVRGSCKPDIRELKDSVQEIPRSSIHSRKPPRFREIIDELYTEGRRAELFATEKADGWDSYGDAIN